MSNAVEEIYNSYKKIVYCYFYKSTYNYHISEELTQDTFLKAYKYLGTFRGESSIKTWIFKIARNTYITYIKRNERIKEEDIDKFEALDLNDAFVRSDERMLIRKVLSKLSEAERTLIILRDIDEFTYLEIANIMDFTEGKVKIGLHRARTKFRAYYDNEVREG